MKRLAYQASTRAIICVTCPYSKCNPPSNKVLDVQLVFVLIKVKCCSARSINAKPSMVFN